MQHSETGLATPIVSDSPGFVGGGQTAGGAAEFTIPNGPIPSGATINYSSLSVMKLRPTETELIGKWEIVDGQIRRDATCERIEWLTANYLEKVAVSKQWGEWETLFRDPSDGRYWERTYPQSEMHGGGPPRLSVLNAEQAHAKYEFP